MRTNSLTCFPSTPSSYCMLFSFKYIVGLCGLGETCSPRDPKFARSNPAAVDGFFQDVQVLRERLWAGGSESEISASLKNLKPEKIAR